MKTMKELLLRDLEEENISDQFGDNITVRTRAAIGLLSAARVMGILDRVWLVLSRLHGNIDGVAANSPRRVERRETKWRGQEKGTVSLDPTSTDGSGESDSLDLMGDNLWSLFQQKTKPKKP